MIVAELEAVFTHARQAIRVGADERTIVDILKPFLDTIDLRCSLMMHLARAADEVLGDLPAGHYEVNMHSRDEGVALLARDLFIAVGNDDGEAACYLWHQQALEDQVAVLAALLRLVTSLVRGS